MIRLGDAATLALTKLKTRKIRTIVTIVTASLLFSTLAFAVFVAGGVLDSTKRFTTGNLSERYIANVTFTGSDNGANEQSVQDRANALYPQVVAEKKAVAKQLGIEYDPKTEPKPVVDGGGGVYLNMESLAARRALNEYQKKQPTAREKLEAIAEKYHPKAYFSFGHSTVNGQMKLLKNGKEDFTEKINPFAYNSTQDITNGWSYLSSSVLEPFFVDQKYLDLQQNKNDLPIVAPFSKVEAALELKPLAKNAPAKERLDRINEVRERAATVTFTTCYRNSASQDQIDQALRVAREIEQNKNNKDYQKPSLIYGLPAAGDCAPAVIQSDKRTAEEKKSAASQLEFSRRFNGIVDPVQQKVVARVVGISPDGFDYTSFSSVDALISMVAGSSLQGSWAVSQEMYDTLPDKSIYEKFYPQAGSSASQTDMAFTPAASQLVEFSNASDAKAFTTKESCTGMDCGGTKPFISYFGSNSVLVEDITANITVALGYGALAIAVIAALILMGMVGRIIGDSRRETAVFRAIGAKRNDIRAIYVMYTIFLALLIAAATMIIGYGAALWLDNQFSAEATVRAQLTFVGVEQGLEFHLIGVWWQALLAIIGLVIAAGLVSMLLPISRNLARSPIKDMRDDT
jgi:hypothetical protein